MNSYEKLIKTMRAEGSRDNPSGASIGDVVRGIEDGLSVSVGDLTYDGDDLLVAEHLTQKTLIKLDIDVKYDGSKCTWEDNSEYSEPLQHGDRVICYPITNELLVVMEKVVEV